MKLILLGPPGAGKGTLASLIKDSLNIIHVSTGDILREEMKNETSLGKEAKQFIESGKLVPDEVVTKLVKNKLETDEKAKVGFLLDGFPRTAQQAEDLDTILEEIDLPLDFAVYMESTLPVIIQRLTGRRVCKICGFTCHATNRPPKQEGVCDDCGGELYKRADDNEETIKTRMNVYLENTTPIIEYYKAKNKLKTLDGDKQSEDLQEPLMATLNEQ